MFGIGMPELILIFVIALIVIGPKKLPEMARSLGKALNEFKSATQDFKNSLDHELRDNGKKGQDDLNLIEQRYREKMSQPGQEKAASPEPRAESGDKEQTESEKPEKDERPRNE